MKFILFLIFLSYFVIELNGKRKFKKGKPFKSDEIERKRNDTKRKTIFDEFLVFFDEDCLDEKNQTHHDMVKEFIDEFECYRLNRGKSSKYRKIGDYWITLDRKKNCYDDDEKEIDFEQYCIVEIEENEKVDFDDNICADKDVITYQLWSLNDVSYLRPNGLQYIEYDPSFDPNLDIIVMDSGVDSSHYEFNDIDFERIFDANDNDLPSDYLDHGTHVAGTIVGQTVGVFKARNTKIKLIDVRIDNSEGGITSADILNGYDSIINYLNNSPNRKVVINMSFGGGNSNEETAKLLAIRNAGSRYLCCCSRK